MATPASYILCGTPRTGSTLLCSLLASTGVLGRPASYFREADEEMWARRFALPTAGGRALDPLLLRLDPPSESSDLAALENAFGPLVFVHLRRDGVLEQAVSWCRAEQTGHWQDGDIASGAHQLDLGRLTGLLREIRAHNAAWQRWFQAQGIEPLVVTYEEAAHVAALREVLGAEDP